MTGARMRRIGGVVVQWTVVWALVYAGWRWLLAPNVSPVFVAAPDAVFSKLGDWWTDGTLFDMIKITLQESLTGLLFGTVAAILIALIVALGPSLIGEVVEPVITAAYAMPKFVFAPLLFVSLGNGFTPRVIFVTISVLPIIFINTMAGMRTVDPARVTMMRLLGSSPRQVSTKLLLPHTLAFLATGLMIASHTSMTAAIGAEILFGAQTGLGGAIYVNGEFFNAVGVFAALLAATVISVVYVRLFQMLRVVGSRAHIGE